MKNEKTELECQECGKVFKRTITDKNMYTMRCPKCRSTDLLPTEYFGISRSK